MTIIDQAGNHLQWTAVYWRYQGQYEERCDSLQEAFQFLSDGEDAGDLSSDRIIGPDGQVVADRAACRAWRPAQEIEP